MLSESGRGRVRSVGLARSVTGGARFFSAGRSSTPGRSGTVDEREAVLLIGHGAIGRHVFEALRGHPRARVVAALCRAGRAGGVRETLGPSVLAVERVAEVPDGLRLAIECAGHAALLEHGPPLLEAGIDLVGVSNGALADDGFARTLEAAAVSGGARCRLLSGAIGAIDALTAARSGGLETRDLPRAQAAGRLARLAGGRRRDARRADTRDAPLRRQRARGRTTLSEERQRRRDRRARGRRPRRDGGRADRRPPASTSTVTRSRPPAASAASPSPSTAAPSRATRAPRR